MQRRYAHAALWPIVFVLLGLVLVKADVRRSLLLIRLHEDANSCQIYQCPIAFFAVNMLLQDR